MMLAVENNFQIRWDVVMIFFSGVRRKMAVRTAHSLLRARPFRLRLCRELMRR